MSLRNCWKPKMGHIPMCSECNTLCIAILPLQTLRWIAFALGRIAFASGSLNLPSGPAIRFRLCLCSRNPTLKHRSLVDATMTENRGSGAGIGGAHGPNFGAGPSDPPGAMMRPLLLPSERGRTDGGAGGSVCGAGRTADGGLDSS